MLRTLIDLFRHARRTVVLTGAGISTPSGIPDFRTARSGLWQSADPAEVASLAAFLHDPRPFYEWVTPLVESVLHARPNAAHHALADLERSGRIHAIITQNIDNLHQQAGSRTVHAIHGHLREMACLGCGRLYDSRPFLAELVQRRQVPFCDCGGTLKPQVVLFGEALPRAGMLAAQEAAEQCDLMIVAGSSLEVHPAAGLPLVAKRAGARLAIINLTPTALDQSADIVLLRDVTEVLPRLAAPFLSRF
jgi:NAD-dependent deacetylase